MLSNGFGSPERPVIGPVTVTVPVRAWVSPWPPVRWRRDAPKKTVRDLTAPAAAERRRTVGKAEPGQGPEYRGQLAAAERRRSAGKGKRPTLSSRR